MTCRNLPIGVLVMGINNPHRFVINLGEDVKVSGFRYLPRAEESYPGMIKKYKAYVKSTPFNF